jgi:hypothetical protein
MEEKSILKMTFDEWLERRTGMNEAELRKALDASLPYLHYDAERVDAVIKKYRDKFRYEMDCYAAQNIELTFNEWLEVYERHTPASFHDMCVNTGMTKKEEEWAFAFLRDKYQRHQALALNPFEK